MGLFEKEKDAVIFRENGEIVRIEAWNRDSLRVRSCLVVDIKEGEVALLEKQECMPEIRIEENKASITNGKITAVLEFQPWGRTLRTAFYNHLRP